MPESNTLEIVLTESEKIIFESINDLIRKDAVFLGNFWVNHPEKGGYFEIRLKYRNEIIIFVSDRCHPLIFGPS